MADIYTRIERSALMAKVRGRGNLTTEQALAKLLRAQGWSGWRRQQVVRGRTAGGERFQVRPDFVFDSWSSSMVASGMAVRGTARGRRPMPPSGGVSSGGTSHGTGVTPGAYAARVGASCGSGSMS